MTTPSQVRINRLRRNGSSSSSYKSPCLSMLINNTLKVGLVFFMVGYLLFVYQSLHDTTHHETSSSSAQAEAIVVARQQQSFGSIAKSESFELQTKQLNDEKQQQQQQPAATTQETAVDECSFRHYPPRRYYGLSDAEQPDFLAQADYIYGEMPMLLKPSSKMEKLCVNQSEWLDKMDTNRLPFADGTNPSILHIDRLKETSHYPQLQQQGVTYIATICMTNSQCQWKDTPDEILRHKLSEKKKPNTVRTLLLLLNEHFQVIQESTILFERDAVWGSQKLKPRIGVNGGKAVTEVRPLDDARLFVYQQKVWVSYRDGKAFGYDKQVLNPLHISGKDVSIQASETLTFCCGRNMALMTPADHTLQSLTWVDPVTVIDVHTVKNVDENHRRLGGGGGGGDAKKSHVHGTNAFMVPYGENELLGMAHFHRPPDRKENEYARFGHHYTHAFFTISAQAPFRLKRLSAEFVLPSQHHNDDAEIIQFISGLEVHGDQVVLAWGINDCEGAAGTIDVGVVNKLMRNVSEGKEVVDFMRRKVS